MPLGDNLRARIVESTGTTYYVDDATGLDTNNGLSEGAAWKTLQHAANTINFGTVTGGARVLVKNHAGTGYKGDVASGVDGASLTFSDLTSGGRTAPDATHVATFQNYPGHRPVILPPDEDAGGDERNCVRFENVNARYVRLRGFELKGDGLSRPGDAPAVTVGSNSHHIEFDDCWIHDVKAKTNGSTAKAQGLFLDELSDNVQVWNTKIWAIGNDATAQANLEHGAYLQGTNHQFVNVISYDNRNGFGFQLFGDTTHTAPGHILAHCVAANNKKSGVTIDGTTYTGIIIANSIFYDNDESGIVSSNSATVTARNTISNGNAVNFEQLSGSTLTQINTLTSDPLFRDFPGRDFRLLNGSPAIGHSDDLYSPPRDLLGTVRPQETGTDDGAYEFILPQYLRPDQDITDGGWTPSTGVDLYATIDETTASDTDFDSSATAPTNDLAEIRLSDPATEPSVDTDHVLRFRYRKENAAGPTTELRVRLLQGATPITTRTIADISGTWTTENYAIPSGDIASISNYNDLRIDLRANQAAGQGQGSTPTFFGLSAAAESLANPGNLTLTLPASIAANDIIWIHAFYNGTNANINTPSGYTNDTLGETTATGNMRHKMFWKRADGTEGGTTVTVTKTGGLLLFIARAYVIRGCKTTGDPYELLTESFFTANPTTFAAMTLGGTNRLLAAFIINDDDDENLPNLTGSNVTFTERGEYATPTGTDGTMQMLTAPADSLTSITAASYNQTAFDVNVLRQLAFLPTGSPDTRAQVSWVEVEIPQGDVLRKARVLVQTDARRASRW